MAGLVRGISFTGSMPFDTRGEGMRRLAPLGNYLLALPQGELERRQTWIFPMIERLVSALSLRVAEEGRPEYGQLPQYAFDGDRMDIPRSVLGIEGEIDDAIAAATVVRREFPNSFRSTPLLVGLPHAADLAGFCFTPEQAKRWMRDVEAVIAKEATAIVGKHGSSSTAIMLESPFTMQSILEAHQRREDVAPLVKRFAKGFADMASRLPEHTPVYIHLCHGDFQGKSKHSWTNVALTVEFVNAIGEVWPNDLVTLGGVHMPFFGGANLPIVLERDMFRPLDDLNRSIPVIYGGVHPMVTSKLDISFKDAFDINRRAYHAAAEALNMPFKAISWPCGGGRLSGKGLDYAFRLLNEFVLVDGAYGPPQV